MRETPPTIFKRGDFVRITADDRTVDGMVTLASPNGVSLVIQYEAILRGYAGAMPLFFFDGEFRTLGTHDVVVLAPKALH